MAKCHTLMWFNPRLFMSFMLLKWILTTNKVIYPRYNLHHVSASVAVKIFYCLINKNINHKQVTLRYGVPSKQLYFKGKITAQGVVKFWSTNCTVTYSQGQLGVAFKPVSIESTCCCVTENRFKLIIYL